MPALALAIASLAWIQTPDAGAIAPPAPSIRGQVVDALTRAPIANAKVAVAGLGAESLEVSADAAGSFVLAERPRCSQSGSSTNEGADYLRITAPGFAVALVDPCANPPWADPIPMRRTGSLSGTLKGSGLRAVAVTVDAEELSWPPRSGLTCSGDESWRGWVDDAGHFEIAGVPAQVPIALRVFGEDARNSVEVERTIVLQPGESRVLELDPADAREPARGSEGPVSTRWLPTDLKAAGPQGGARALAWFELLRGAREVRHRNAGGRWHVHNHRACTHLEVQPGPNAVVARDADGWIGVRPLDVDKDAKSVEAKVTLAPGALLRVDASAIDRDASVAFEFGGVEFAKRELHAGVVRFEVVPAGNLRVTVRVEGREPVVRELAVAAGAVTSLAL